MITLLNFPPHFCPHCGNELDFSTPDARQDFMAGCSHTCTCGNKFARANTDELINANTASGGDLEYNLRAQV